ncbi:MAG: Gmad2 immunoglobulin-like domain-containing protein [Chloroflexota bacterium]|nr:Gmad2 immunoglobulin-like domain-containing protein [Chloroflexota bacterium]
MIASCGSAGTPGQAPTPLATACCPPTPSPVVSAKGAISLTTPTAYASLTSPVTISGDASVFEAALAWRITDTAGRVIVEGNTTASLGAPGRGTYSVSATYTVATRTVAFIEVFSRSAKDGNIDEIVRISVTLR